MWASKYVTLEQELGAEIERQSKASEAALHAAEIESRKLLEEIAALRLQNENSEKQLNQSRANLDSLQTSFSVLQQEHQDKMTSNQRELERYQSLLGSFFLRILLILLLEKERQEQNSEYKKIQLQLSEQVI